MDGGQEAKLAVILWEIAKQLLEAHCMWSFHGNQRNWYQSGEREWGEEVDNKKKKRKKKNKKENKNKVM